MATYSNEEVESKRIAAMGRKKERETIQGCRSAMNYMLAKIVKVEIQEEEVRKADKWRKDGEMKFEWNKVGCGDDSFLVEELGN
jgi:hypothetical protein